MCKYWLKNWPNKVFNKMYYIGRTIIWKKCFLSQLQNAFAIFFCIPIFSNEFDSKLTLKPLGWVFQYFFCKEHSKTFTRIDCLCIKTNQAHWRLDLSVVSYSLNILLLGMYLHGLAPNIFILVTLQHVHL